MYMKHILNISDVKRRFLENRFGLLKEIIQSSLIRIPFQNVTQLVSVNDSEDARPLTIQQILRDAFQGVGGLCAHNNYFLKMQLESIGYNVKTISGCFRRTGVPSSHFITFIKVAPNRKSPEKEYVIDLGCGVPLHEPIPLNDLPFIGRAGGLNYRYERIDNNNLQRVHENGDAIVGSKPGSFLSPQDYTIDLTSKTFPDFTTMFEKFAEFARNRKTIAIQKEIYCFRYLNITDTDFDIVCIRGLALIRITKETRTSQVLTNYEELRKSIYEYFPMINPTDVDKAVENFKQYKIQGEECLKDKQTKSKII